MTTHYRDDEVMVTSTHLRITDQTWRLSDLEFVWHRETQPDWRVRGRTARRGVLNVLMILSGFVGALILIGVAASAYVEIEADDLPLNTMIIVAVLLLLAGFVPLLYEWALSRVDDSYDKGDAIYEMWARVGGQDVLLLRLPDITRFSKIYRAVQRAVDP